MQWANAAWFVALLTLFTYAPFHLERAAQLATMGVLLDVTDSIWIGRFVKAPILWFVLAAILFEILHFVHKQKRKTMRHTWVQLERLRAQKNLATLIDLKLQTHASLFGAELEAIASSDQDANAQESEILRRADPTSSRTPQGEVSNLPNQFAHGEDERSWYRSFASSTSTADAQN